MLNLVRKNNVSARHLQTSARSAALVQKQHHNYFQPPPVIAAADLRKGKEKEHDVVLKPVNHGAPG